MISVRFAKWNLIAVSLTLLLLFLLIDPNGEGANWQRFTGRFHPAYVHFPIGMVILALALTILRSIGWMKQGDNVINVTLILGSWAGIQAVAAGSWLAQMGGYPADVLFLHKLSGYAVTIVAALLPLLRLQAVRRESVAAIWTVAVIVVSIGGDLGGRMTHGDGYTTEYTPEFVRNVLGHPDPMTTRFLLVEPDTMSVYAGIISPILIEKCSSCHGPDREENRLRLHTPETIQNHEVVGEDDPLILAGRPDKSLLIQRISLPEGHKDQMPPPQDGKPISHADVELLKWWIAEGASFDRSIADTPMPASIAVILQAYGLGEILTGIFALDVPLPDTAAIADLNGKGASVETLAEGSPFLSVHCPIRRSCFTGDALGRLSANVAWLDASASDVTDEDLSVLAGFPHITRLDLSNTGVDGSGLSALGDFTYLEYLNLYGSRINDDGLKNLESLEGLKNLYLWQTETTSEGVERLKTAIPGVKINTGAAN